MKKISISLDPALDRELAKLAARLGVSKAEYIRRVLKEAVIRTPRARLSAIGKGAGPGDVSENIDRYLAETGFGEA